ncbi:MAG: ribosome maturation factor RimP [Deltaproteobacteria bacterium]|nr:ribosome maturation factor RimP [Deltaproteobacteria bacterium]
MDNRVLESQIREMIEPSVTRLGYDLVAVEYLGGTGTSTLRVSIDKPGGINADDCGIVSEKISPVLDEEDPIASKYHLEVSSPGIERPLQRPVDFTRFLGYRARIRASAGAQRRRATGTLKRFEPGTDVVTLLVDGVDVVLPLDLIERAHLVLTLEEYQQLAEESGHDE